MRSFQFSLESVLSWRLTELRAEEARLAPLVAERGRLETAHLEIVRAHGRAQQDLLSSGPVDGAELGALVLYRARLEKQKTIVEQKARQCHEQIAAQQSRIEEAQREGSRDGEFCRGGVSGALADAPTAWRAFQYELRSCGGPPNASVTSRRCLSQESADACGCTDR